MASRNFSNSFAITASLFAIIFTAGCEALSPEKVPTTRYWTAARDIKVGEIASADNLKLIEKSEPKSGTAGSSEFDGTSIESLQGKHFVHDVKAGDRITLPLDFEFDKGEDIVASFMKFKWIKPDQLQLQDRHTLETSDLMNDELTLAFKTILASDIMNRDHILKKADFKKDAEVIRVRIYRQKAHVQEYLATELPEADKRIVELIKKIGDHEDKENGSIENVAQ